MRKPLVALLMIAALGLSACSRAPVRRVAGNPVPAPQATAADGGGPLNVYLWSDTRLALALLDGFRAEYPGIPVQLQQYAPQPGDPQYDPIGAARKDLDAGKIDVFPGALVDQGDGTSVALDTLIAKSALDLAPYGDVPEQLRSRGRLFEMPFLANPPVVAYNRTMFEAAGLPLPAPGWTWDDLRAAAVKLTHGAGDQKVWGLNIGGGLAVNLATSWFEQRAPGSWQSDEPVLREGLQFFTGLVADGVMPPQAPISPGSSPHYYFSWEQAALEYNVFGTIRQQTQAAKVDWGIAPLPTQGAPVRSLSGGAYGTLAISAKSARQDAAWKFVSFACGPKGARLLAALGQVPFYRSAVVTQAWFQATPPPPAGSQILFDLPLTVAGHGRSLTETDRQAYRLIDESLSAVRPWEEALANYLQARSQPK